MISEFGLSGGPEIESPFCNLSQFVDLKVHGRLFGLFDSSHTCEGGGGGGGGGGVVKT